eukprot:831-Pyramimonas_sp.AAC.1
MRTDGMMWKTAGLLCGFRDLRFDGSGYEVSSLLEKLIRCHHNNTSKDTLQTELNANELRLLDVFHLAGLVHTTDCSGQPMCSLTEAGRHALCFVHRLVSPSPCFDIRVGNVPLEDRTVYEFILLLKDEGWRWARLPDRVENRVALSYNGGADKVWYTRTLGVIPTCFVSRRAAAFAAAPDPPLAIFSRAQSFSLPLPLHYSPPSPVLVGLRKLRAACGGDMAQRRGTIEDEEGRY